MRTLAAVIAAAAFAAPACCEDAPNYSHPPYQHPFEATLRAAEHGDVAAQVHVGRDYEKALGVEQDLGRAVDWYREAADAGSPQGMLALGLLLEDQSLSRAADEKPEPWLLRAAQAGLADAQVAEAKFHSTRNSPEGKKIEIEWLGHAVAQGDLKAMSLLGPMLVVSDDPNERQRGEQYIFAAEKAYPKTRLAAESGKFFRDYGTPELKTAKITEQFRRAALTLDIEEARNDGQGGFGTLAVVMVIAGSFNTDDPGLRDGTFLQKRLEEAAQSGNLQSACNLAFLKLEQVPRDKEQKYYRDAFDLYLSAANRGAPRAQYHLGKLYRDGLGTDASASNAAMWFYRAAMHGYPPAEAALGDLLLHGNGVPADYGPPLGLAPSGRGLWQYRWRSSTLDRCI